MPEERFDFLAVGGDVSDYGLLPPPAVAKWTELERLIHSRWTSPDDLKSSARSIAGCLEKLGASLLQAHRMKNHHDGLLTIARDMRESKPALAAFKGAEACADFESMLLQGRATLDRLTWFVSQEFRNKTTSFPRLRTILGQFRDQPTAMQLIRILEEADEWFDGTYGPLTSSSSLRDLVAHFHSLTEGTRSCFGVTYLDEGSCLLLDCEVALPRQPKALPVLKTAHTSVRWLSFLVLNSLAAITGADTLDVGEFEPNWKIESTVLSEFIASSPSSSISLPFLSVRKMTPDGFEFGTDLVLPEIFERTVNL